MANSYSWNFAVTPKNKITNISQAKESTSFWNSLLGFIGITTISIVAGIVTGGVGTVIGEYLGLSLFGVEALSFGFGSVTQFAIDTTYDVLTNNASFKNILLNFAFDFAEIGRLGRALRADKIKKLANELKYFDKLGVKGKVNNFAKLRKALEYQTIIVKPKRVIKFGKVISNDDILMSITAIANMETRNTIKKMTKEQVENLISITRALNKYAPGLVKTFSIEEIQSARKWMKGLGYDLDKFMKLTDEEALVFLTNLSKTSRISLAKIQMLDNLRKSSNFYMKITKAIKDIGRWTSKISTYADPVYWLKKLLKEIIKPFEEGIMRIRQKIIKKFGNKAEKVGVELAGNKIPPTNPATSIFSYFKLIPLGVSGEVMLHMVKKPHIKKDGTISRYNDINVITTLTQAELFLTHPHQNHYYLKESGWALGWVKFSSTKTKSLVTPFLGSAIIRSSIAIYSTISKIANGTIFNKFTLSSISGANWGNYLIGEGSNLLSQAIFGNNLFGSLISSGIQSNITASQVTHKITSKFVRDAKYSSIRWKGY